MTDDNISAEAIEGGLRFRLPKGHPSLVEVARIHVVCVRHLDDRPLGTYVLAGDGTEFTVTHPGFKVEFVHDKPLDTPPNLPAILKMPDGYDPSSPSHVRHRFTCQRPSCQYDAAVRCDGDNGQWSRVTAALQGMHAAGIFEVTITNVDADPWRVVST